jgi:thioesterase domain-containing protein
VRRITETRLAVSPWPFVEVGQRVRVEAGALRDLEGIVVATKSRRRLIVSIRLLNRSAAVELSADWISVPWPKLLEDVSAENSAYLDGLPRIAYEIARQLLEADEEVTFVGLIDTYVRDPSAAPTEGQKRKAQWWLKVKDDDALRTRFEVAKACSIADQNYRAEPLYILVTLFATTEREAISEDPLLFWGPLLGHRSSCLQGSRNHDSVVNEPHVGALADACVVCDQPINPHVRKD